MSEFAPGSPWKAMMLLALPLLLPLLLPLPTRAFAMSRSLPTARPEARRQAKNPAKSETCDVPPREPHAAIGYYWRRWGRATATSENIADPGTDYGQFQHCCGLHSGLGPFRDGGWQGFQRRGPSAQARQAGARRRRRGADRPRPRPPRPPPPPPTAP